MNRTAALLSELVACATVNPPGETRRVAELLRDRFAPLADNETLVCMHGNDERIGVAALAEGTEWVFRVLVATAGKA